MEHLLLFLFFTTLAFLVVFRVTFTASVPRGIYSSMTFQNVRQAAKTGDLLLFSGRGLDSQMVKAWTQSWFSHVGMIINLSEYHQLDSSDSLMGAQSLYVWNSNVDATKRCALSGERKSGIQLNDFDLMCNAYDGTVFFLPLQSPLAPLQLKRLWDLIRLWQFASFDKNLFHQFSLAFPYLTPQRTSNFAQMMCSEMLILAYDRLRVTERNRHVPSTEVLPWHFADPSRRLGTVAFAPHPYRIETDSPTTIPQKNWRPRAKYRSWVKDPDRWPNVPLLREEEVDREEGETSRPTT